ncbi:hypothetical protein MSPP1_002656 [Malassezia sp. CBS 17886]|nr:hypothetical protein MSPP1_002656 [Malassezia sp. CBS 17886]
MTTKHVYDDSNGLVDKAVQGIAALNPELGVYLPHRIVYDKSHPRDKVAVIAGGGSGHEPSFAGLTGRGLVTASVSGDVFASPSTAQICSGIDLAPSDKGVLIVVNNYTGDCLNFGVAAEKARGVFAAEGAKKEVEMVIVADDVSVGRKKGGLVGRRGLTGSPVIAKIVGAAAQQGLDVQALAKLGRAAVDNFVTIGSSLDHCHVPGRPAGDEERGALGPNAIEIGMGIHNEPGVKHLEQKPKTQELLAEMLSLLLKQDDEERSFVPFSEGDEPVLVINNLGGLSNLELSAITGDVIDHLRDQYKIRPVRVYAGAYITSLNAPGFGISLINHKRATEQGGVDILSLLDAPTDAPGWHGVQHGWSSHAKVPTTDAYLAESKKVIDAKQKSGHAVSGVSTSGASASGGPVSPYPELTKKVIANACKAVIDIEPTLTKYDTVVGDGDAGETLRGAGEAVLKALDQGKIPLERPTAALLGVSSVLESAMGGTSGALYALFLAGLVQGLLKSTKDTSEKATVKNWSEAVGVAMKNLSNYTPARPGDSTLVDALEPFCRTLKEESAKSDSAKPAMDAAVAAAKKGAESTRDMVARLGRATYVGETAEKVPDPGAWGIWALVKGIDDAL